MNEIQIKLTNYNYNISMYTVFFSERWELYVLFCIQFVVGQWKYCASSDKMSLLKCYFNLFIMTRNLFMEDSVEFSLLKI